MSKRMTSETIIFDTDWLTEADFGEEEELIVSIDYQAYDTLKIITSPNIPLAVGAPFQEFDVYKLENFGSDYKTLLREYDENFEIEHAKDEGDFVLAFYIIKNYWENELEGTDLIYIKGVKR